MQLINQKQYLIDNIPAGKFGEWPGIKPNKWNGSIKIIRPQDQDVFSDETNINLRGRRHFSAKHSNEMSFKPGMKLFMDVKNKTEIEEKPKGLKACNTIFSQTKIDFPKKHFPVRYGIEVDPEPFQIRTFYPDGNCRTHLEQTLEKEVGGKKRIPNLDVMRNGMLLRAPGDKIFRNPEYSKDFFKEGGLIPGSSFNPNYQKTVGKRSDTFYQTLDLSKKTLNPDKLWKNKIKKESFEYDNNYVKTLTNWDNTVLKEYQPPEPKAVKGQTGHASNRGPSNDRKPINKPNSKPGGVKK